MPSSPTSYGYKLATNSFKTYLHRTLLPQSHGNLPISIIHQTLFLIHTHSHGFTVREHFSKLWVQWSNWQSSEIPKLHNHVGLTSPTFQKWFNPTFQKSSNHIRAMTLSWCKLEFERFADTSGGTLVSEKSIGLLSAHCDLHSTICTTSWKWYHPPPAMATNYLPHHVKNNHKEHYTIPWQSSHLHNLLVAWYRRGITLKKHFSKLWRFLPPFQLPMYTSSLPALKLNPEADQSEKPCTQNQHSNSTKGQEKQDYSEESVAKTEISLCNNARNCVHLHSSSHLTGLNQLPFRLCNGFRSEFSLNLPGSQTHHHTLRLKLQR